MASHDRQVNFSRTVWTTFHRRGMTSSVSVIVSPSLASLPPQHGHAFGISITTRSRGRCSGSGARTGLRRVNASTEVPSGAVAVAASPGGRFQFFEFQFHLVEQFAAAFGRGAEAVMFEFGDQQL